MWWWLFLLPIDEREAINKALQAKQYEQAATMLAKVVKEEPTDSGAHYNLGLVRTFLKQDSAAEGEFREALRLQPSLFPARMNLALVLMRLSKFDEALPLVVQAAKEKPGDLSAQFTLGQIYLKLQKPEPATVALQAAVTIDPANPGAHLMLAQALRQQGNLDQAAPHYLKAAELDRSYRDGLLELANAYEEAKRLPEAIAIYRQFPDDSVVKERLGSLELQSGNAAQAIPELEQAVRSSPTAANWYALGTAYLRTKEPIKATQAFGKAAELAPDRIELIMTYGRALRDQRQLPAAIDQFGRAARLQPTLAEAWRELAGVLVVADRRTEALAALDHLRELNAETAGSVFLRAIILDKLKQYQPALEAYQSFLAQSSNLPDQEFQARQRVKTLKLVLSKR